MYGKVGEADKSLFCSSKGDSCIKGYLKVSEGVLFPLRRAFLFGFKPLVCIPHTHVESVRIGRGGAVTSRTFDLDIITRDGKTTQVSMLEADELEALKAYVGTRTWGPVGGGGGGAAASSSSTTAPSAAAAAAGAGAGAAGSGSGSGSGDGGAAVSPAETVEEGKGGGRGGEGGDSSSSSAAAAAGGAASGAAGGAASTTRNMNDVESDEEDEEDEEYDSAEDAEEDSE